MLYILCESSSIERKTYVEMQNILKKFKEMNGAKKVLFILALFVLIVAFYALTIYSIGSFFKTITGGAESEFYYALVDSSGRPVSIIVILLFTVVIAISLMHINRRNDVKTSDDRGVHIMKDKTHGRGEWLNNDEEGMKDAFLIDDIHNTLTTIYGQKKGTKNGKQVVGYKKYENGPTGTRNVCCIAVMGSGKTYCYANTEVIQAMLRGDSVIMTDPKGEGYKDLSYISRQLGRETGVLNLVSPAHSDYWNILDETIEPLTGRVSALRISQWVRIYMENATSDKKKDFWYDCAVNLIEAVIGFTAWQKEEPIMNNFVTLYRSVSINTENKEREKVIRKMTGRLCSFSYCEEVIRKEAQAQNLDLDYINQLIDDIKEHSSEHKFNIGEVYDNLRYFKQIEEGFESIPEWHPAKTAYETYIDNDTEQIRKSALQGAKLRMKIFEDPDIREMLSHDGIRMKEINLIPVTYFVIMSDKSGGEVLKPISSLFFSFAFKEIEDNYDRENNKAEYFGTENKCLPVVAMLDEFYSIGMIGGDIDVFGKTMSTSRSRKLYISIIIQTYSQIEAIYGPLIRDVIISGCSTILYMGGNDPNTCRFISEFLAGKTTVLDEAHHEPTGLLRLRTMSDMMVKSTQRDLLDLLETRLWNARKDGILVVRQSCLPLIVDQFPWVEHPYLETHEVKKSSIEYGVKTLEERADEREEDTTDYETLLHVKLKNAFVYASKEKQLQFDETTGEIIEDDDIIELINFEDNLNNLENKDKENNTSKDNSAIPIIDLDEEEKIYIPTFDDDVSLEQQTLLIPPEELSRLERKDNSKKLSRKSIKQTKEKSVSDSSLIS